MSSSTHPSPTFFSRIIAHSHRALNAGARSKSPANRVDFVAHSFGGVCTVELLAKMERSSDFRRIGKVALTDSVHADDAYPLSIRKWLTKNAVNYERSSEKLGLIMNKPTDGCVSVSAGHPKHEYTSGVAIESVFKFLSGQPDFFMPRR